MTVPSEYCDANDKGRFVEVVEPILVSDDIDVLRVRDAARMDCPIEPIDTSVSPELRGDSESMPTNVR